MSDQPATKLYMALLSAAKDFGPVLKNANNPAFRTKYADLGAVLDAVTDPLANHGILLLQRFTHDQGGALLITELVHAESGQAIASVVPVVAKDPTDPQKMGGAITYYRRYSLLALLGLAPEDDDGNAASKPAPRPEIKRGKPEPYHEMHMVESAPAPRPTPPPAADAEHPLLATIRDDTAAPSKRLTALHNYLMDARSLDVLAYGCNQALAAGIPESDVERAKAWHNERITTGKAPAPKKAPPPASIAG